MVGHALQRIVLSLVIVGSLLVTATPASAQTPPNIVIFMSDDQRWDMVTPTFTPQIHERLVAGNPYAFTNAFVPDPVCCPSRASTLTGNHAHTTGVWSNVGPHGGFDAFDDKHTLAVDLQLSGYRTAMIGKYMNGYVAGRNTYVPPGWDRWFAVNTRAYYDYRATTHRTLLRFESEPQHYITRVLAKRATKFVGDSIAVGEPFFLYLAFTAPHRPSIPDPRDVGRFEGVDTGLPITQVAMLESAYGVDRAVGKLLDVLPSNTIVVYMSDNGFLWGESKGTWGPLEGKQWPYDGSIRIPLIVRSLDGTITPTADPNDLVLNIDLRTSLTHAAGIAPVTKTDGIDWFSPTYVARRAFPLEFYREPGEDVVPTYCGVRTATHMYVRYASPDGGYSEEAYRVARDHPPELENLALAPWFDVSRLRQRAEDLCDPAPPGYAW